ncbi:hypothetical protein M427DRAFT_55710 [Gonapodya prolifera JEL478]|uniref:Uncharacterized protein n=1 Tax=Gonapodya prolifera (strain JEL478) TaxID=1344416 RepID=A0A139AHV8_GONPJ|nr:hypothetical protein M427DRAFT_55710 [Gonapodya prolifera JEL478]|eukprot:KXS16279.1 hypothetical protein M427DRAFT_55710 [Gonapodya prolifera JEL478]
MSNVTHYDALRGIPLPDCLSSLADLNHSSPRPLAPPQFLHDLASKIRSPVVSMSLLGTAVVAVVCSIVVGLTYDNGVRVFNTRVRHPSINQGHWVAFFAWVAIAFTLDAVRYLSGLPNAVLPSAPTGSAHTHATAPDPAIVSPYFLMMAAIARSTASFCLALALTHQWRWRSKYNRIPSYMPSTLVHGVSRASLSPDMPYIPRDRSPSRSASRVRFHPDAGRPAVPSSHDQSIGLPSATGDQSSPPPPYTPFTSPDGPSGGFITPSVSTRKVSVASTVRSTLQRPFFARARTESVGGDVVGADSAYSTAETGSIYESDYGDDYNDGPYGGSGSQAYGGATASDLRRPLLAVPASSPYGYGGYGYGSTGMRRSQTADTIGSVASSTYYHEDEYELEHETCFECVERTVIGCVAGILYAIIYSTVVVAFVLDLTFIISTVTGIGRGMLGQSPSDTNLATLDGIPVVPPEWLTSSDIVFLSSHIYLRAISLLLTFLIAMTPRETQLITPIPSTGASTLTHGPSGTFNYGRGAHDHQDGRPGFVGYQYDVERAPHTRAGTLEVPSWRRRAGLARQRLHGPSPCTKLLFVLGACLVLVSWGIEQSWSSRLVWEHIDTTSTLESRGSNLDKSRGVDDYVWWDKIHLSSVCSVPPLYSFPDVKFAGVVAGEPYSVHGWASWMDALNWIGTVGLVVVLAAVSREGRRCKDEIVWVTANQVAEVFDGRNR